MNTVYTETRQGGFLQPVVKGWLSIFRNKGENLKRKENRGKSWKNKKGDGVFSKFRGGVPGMAFVGFFSADGEAAPVLKLPKRERVVP